MNYLTLGNALPHLHTHLVPRQADDPVPGGPLPFDVLDQGRRSVVHVPGGGDGRWAPGGPGTSMVTRPLTT